MGLVGNVLFEWLFRELKCFSLFHSFLAWNKENVVPRRVLFADIGTRSQFGYQEGLNLPDWGKARTGNMNLHVFVSFPEGLMWSCLLFN